HVSTRSTWTHDDDARLRELHAAETPVRAMASTLGRSRTATARRLAHLGLSAADRTRTAAATHARVTDARARRATLRSDLLADAERVRTQLWQPHTYFDWGGKDHDFAEHTVPEPTPTDKLKLAQTVNTLVGSIERLEKMDADQGVAEAIGMLDGIAAAITAAADRMPDPDLEPATP
ncbi:hypothetical protein, partial [Cellulomonas sp. A375-1]|uniref:hypothetical protein n=1 Tax=Cellulomonas sp. A375-1 TaxID=1672219 RepID=UPI001E322FD4